MSVLSKYIDKSPRLGTVHNALFWINQSADFELWAKEKYPKEWEDLEQLGGTVDPETGEKVFSVDRTIEI